MAEVKKLGEMIPHSNMRSFLDNRSCSPLEVEGDNGHSDGYEGWIPLANVSTSKGAEICQLRS